MRLQFLGLALGIGLFVVACARYAGAIPGNITAVTNKTVNLLVAPIFTLFVFALFMRKVGTVGAWIGAVVGTMVAACISFSGPLVYYLHTHFGIDPAIFDVKIIEATNAATGLSYSTCEDPISFQYIGPVSLVAGIGAGALAGWIWPRHDQRKPEYTTTTSRPRK